MRHILLASLLVTTPAFLLAQETRPLEDELLDFFEDLTGPLLPLFDDLTGQIQDLSNYHAPEILPNGDILIRKRKPEEEAPKAAPEPQEDGDVMIDL